MNELEKVALVTGGGRGIGRAISLELAKSGYYVIVNYSRSKEEAEKVVDEIKQAGGNATPFKAPVQDFEACKEMADYVLENFKRIDVLVNNAGITRDQLFVRMKEDDFDDVININLKGVYNCTKAFSKAMLKQKSGCIINMASVSGVVGNPGQSNYSASKAGVIGFTKSLARELGSRGIRVNAVAPGFIDTEMTEGFSEELKNEIVNETCLGRFGAPEEVAEAVGFLANSANYITGQVINVDGGMAM
ncbi:3-oxoacyl-[acyl-carrier-protein] reductase [Natranaerofaba carboxydovora]|uniref:3-oxoacyl-[acyl-carrier-protein] reductase n=1 Tax=Natranaerofaba carboxydovora TaxID=2742683 RepID=UPI001F148F2F|nr:3-oxoacyl-[acyl-carrier-protein] reductase [Natranaerofaba carboxydovora]UMZ73325.1 3-oxoacyl-[acyl-carrier-protein] reductase FabG [Natranaerofaba carboxydovora]